jgi:hypothetical protein
MNDRVVASLRSGGVQHRQKPYQVRDLPRPK